MRFTPTPIPGAYVIELEPIEDERGFFARAFCQAEFAAHGLEAAVAQCNVSYNRTKGTLRGLHYQAPPHEEAKLIRCTAGAVFDVIVDLRRDSPARGRWYGLELSAGNRRLMFAPRGVAHGFQTLEDNSEVHYQMSAAFNVQAQRGVRWDDPGLAIGWPVHPPIISTRDRELPLLAPGRS
jgi:dTDP-4-dehydrorhamnose 3,5-epimerase